MLGRAVLRLDQEFSPILGIMTSVTQMNFFSILLDFSASMPSAASITL
jgi:hypothetical protein